VFSVSRKRAFILLALLVVATPILPGRSQTPPWMAQVEVTREGGRARFVLRWPGAVATEEIERRGRELTLRFSRPLGGVALDSVPGRLQGWVDNVLYGYDSVLLVLAADVVADVVADRSGVVVTFTKEAKSVHTAGAALAERVARRRLDYFRALTLLEGGQEREARALLRDQAQHGPRDAQSSALLAQTEERLGRWREAAAAYDDALAQTPDEPSLIVGKARLLHENGDRARIDSDWQQVRGADVQRIQRLTGVMNLPGSNTIAYALENRRVDVDAAIHRDGASAPFHGARQRMEFAIAHDWPEGERSTLTFHAAQRVLGVGLTHGWKDEDSETRVGLTWNEPSFATLEGIIGGGRRDRLFVQHEARLSDRWSFGFGVGYNRYGLAGASDLARSASVEAQLRYVLNREGPLASLAYLLDAEYVGRREQREIPAEPRPSDQVIGTPTPPRPGQFFAPLPTATREVHVLQLSVEDWIADYVRYSAQIGYAYDRRGKSGPQGAVSLSWEPLDTLEIGLRASHARSTARGTASAVNAAGGYLLWRY
jgi:tetratricopeptide (TPR) repeat protein